MTGQNVPGIRLQPLKKDQASIRAWSSLFAECRRKFNLSFDVVLPFYRSQDNLDGFPYQFLKKNAVKKWIELSS